MHRLTGPVGQAGITYARQFMRLKFTVGHAKNTWVGIRQPAKGLHRMRGRLQADLGRQQAGRKHHGEVVTVFAQIEHPFASRQ